MSPRTAAPLAWSLCGVYVLLLGFGLVVGLGATPTFSPVGLDVPVWSMALLGLAFLAFSVMGALVAARHPGNAVSWLLLAIGLSGGLTLALIAYVATALPRPASSQATRLACSAAVARWIAISREVRTLAALPNHSGQLT
jgi:hypothetical protein